jgi:hypothetical protein
VAADGTGAALQRVDNSLFGYDPSNWIAFVPGALDTDGDGMPDAYEDANGLNKNSAADAGLDPDGDRMTNLQEYLAGTDPHSAQSLLRIELVSAGPAVLRFTAAADRSYTIEYSDSLQPGVWNSFIDITAEPVSHVVQVTDATPNSHRFYRLRTPQRP